MAEEKEIDPGALRQLTAEDKVTIPGPAGRAFERRGDTVSPYAGPITAVEIVRDQATGQILVADRVCCIGDVIAVADVPRDERGRPMILTSDKMGSYFTREHAERLINTGYAVPTSKPATVKTGQSLRRPEIEKAVIPGPARAQQAVAPRQRAGAI